MIMVMESMEPYRLTPLLLSMSFIFRVGMLEKSQKGMEFCLTEPNFVSGLELNFIMKFYQSLGSNILLSAQGECSNFKKVLLFVIMDSI